MTKHLRAPLLVFHIFTNQSPDDVTCQILPLLVVRKISANTWAWGNNQEHLGELLGRGRQPTKRCLPKLILINQQTHKDRPQLEEICFRVNCNASLNHLLKFLHHLTAATLIGNDHRRFPNYRALEENSHHHQQGRGDNSPISPSINDYRSPGLKKIGPRPRERRCLW